MKPALIVASAIVVGGLGMKAAITAHAAQTGSALPVRATQVAERSSDLPMDIANVEERFRTAKLSNNINALADVLDEAFLETNQNGNSRDKQGMIDLFRDFPIQSLTTDQAVVRVRGDIAVVTGSQTENGDRGDRMLFTRVWVRDGAGWKLLSSTQFRNPKLF
jgi:hypothetical protein